MGVINLLESKVYNQISAGEVVENPASIVKELVENSIDAGANSITVTIFDGGIKSIVVADDGCGMDKNDLQLSILPHATSKIKESADLDTISTLGFRGEALASVAAVSEVEIRSCYNNIANAITVKASEIIEQKETTLNKGTVIKISSLFFNTPARFKFLKSPKSEESNITRLMLELIFANPYIAFKYIADNVIIYQSEGNGMDKVLYSVFDSEFASNMIHFAGEKNGYKIEGYTARPASCTIKNNRKNQIIIVNGRSISEMTISAVVQNAYTDKLMKRTFPSFIIDIIAPFDMIDVNVHPNKREVRFAESRVIHGIIYHTILEALQKDEQNRSSNIFKNIFSMDKNIENLEKVFTAVPAEKEIVRDINIKSTDATDNEQINRQQFYTKDNHNPSGMQFQKEFLNIKTDYNTSGIQFQEELATNSVLKFSDTITEIPAQDNFCEDEKPLYKEDEKPLYKIVGQVFDTYLIIEFTDKLFFIDQHAVHEKILYNRIIESYEKNIQTQDLFIPYEIELEIDDIDYVKDNISILKKLGFVIEFANKSINIMGIPAILMYLDIPAFFNQFIAEKSADKGLSNKIIKEKIAQIACKSAIKGGDKLTDLQIRYVLDYFLENNLPMQCPHGRPTVCEITRNDIEKMFKRVL